MIRILLSLPSYRHGVICTGWDPFSHGSLPQSHGMPNTHVLHLDTLSSAELLLTSRLQMMKMMPKKLMPRLMRRPPPQSQPHSHSVGFMLSLPCSALLLPLLCAAALVGLVYLCFCFCSFPLFLLCFFLLCLLPTWPCRPKC